MPYWWVMHAEEGWRGFAQGSGADPQQIADLLAPNAYLDVWDAPRLELAEGDLADYLECDLPLRLC